MKDKIILWNPEPPESDSDPDPEEKICKKCLEIESECQCAYYDQLEAEELKAIQEDKRPKASSIFKTLFQAQMMNLL
jgi:hypothetical protein